AEFVKTLVNSRSVFLRVTRLARMPRLSNVQPSSSTNSGNRRGGFRCLMVPYAMSCSATLLLVSAQPRDVPAVDALVQEWNEIGHQGEFALAAFAPAEAQWLH